MALFFQINKCNFYINREMLSNTNFMVPLVAVIFSTLFTQFHLSLSFQKTHFTPLMIDNHPCRAEILKVGFPFHFFYEWVLYMNNVTYGKCLKLNLKSNQIVKFLIFCLWFSFLKDTTKILLHRGRSSSMHCRLERINPKRWIKSLQGSSLW